MRRRCEESFSGVGRLGKFVTNRTDGMAGEREFHGAHPHALLSGHRVESGLPLEGTGAGPRDGTDATARAAARLAMTPWTDYTRYRFRV
jgi:hypothetical protein